MTGAALSIACPCGQPSAELFGVAEAVARLSALAAPTGETELLPLSACAGRVAAMTCRAAQPMPFFDNSAMDGFAVSLADFAGGGPRTLPVCGTAAAGQPGIDRLVPGACMRIFTGAPIPPGADSVAPVEQVVERLGRVTFGEPPRRGAHIRRMGSDIAHNEVLVAAGTRISARHVGLLAANGYSSVTVNRRPRVGIFSTGDELVGRGQGRGAAQLHDANRPMLLMMAAQMAADTEDLGIVPDDFAEMRRFLDLHACRFDLLISSGAVSAGGRDFLKSAFLSAGGLIDSWKIALKPGKPVMFGRIDNSVFLGLPGNPMAAWIGFELFGRAAIDRISGAAARPAHPVRAVAENPMPCASGRREYVPVRVVSQTLRGQPRIARVGHGGSASLQPLCQADGVAVVDATTGDVDAGGELDFLPFVQGVLQ